MSSQDTLLHGVPRRHPIFWFNDGSLLLQVQDQLYKLHGEFFYRQSNLIKPPKPSTVDGQIVDLPGSFCHVYVVEPKLRVRSEDVTVLLEHLYHDKPLLSSSSFPQLASIIRATSTHQLDMPSIHRLAISRFEDLYPSTPATFPQTEYLLDAFLLASEFQVTPVRKRLLYGLVITEPVDSPALSMPSSGGSSDVASSISDMVAPTLSASQLQQCSHVMERMISHFTPMLFTPPTTPHMACTDVFADTWMELVIQPALENSGVYKPLETLERIKKVDWAKHGLCRECIREKETEWSDEQIRVWGLLDDWIDGAAIA